MSNPTETVIAYAHALVATFRAFKELEQGAGWFERWQIRLLRKTYQQRLRYLVVTLPPEIGQEFFE